MSVRDYVSAAAADESFGISDLVFVVAGQTIGIGVYQASGSSKNTTAGAQYTFISIEAS